METTAMDVRWIRSRYGSGMGASEEPEKYHLAKLREARGDRTGRLISRYYVAACSGRQLGGPWGYERAEVVPDGEPVCKRCARLKPGP